MNDEPADRLPEGKTLGSVCECVYMYVYVWVIVYYVKDRTCAAENKHSARAASELATVALIKSCPRHLSFSVCVCVCVSAHVCVTRTVCACVCALECALQHM